MKSAAFAALALLLPLGLQAQQGQVGTAGTLAVGTVNEIVDNPGNYYGDEVTVKGEVGEVFGRQMFNIEEKGLIDVDDELLVMVPKELQTTVTENSEVQVTGTVRQFVRADLERDYDIATWGYYGINAYDNDFFVDYDRRPVLIADTVRVEGAVGTAGDLTVATVNDIVDNPANYYGATATVEGEVGDVFGRQMFNIEEKGLIDVDDELLVIVPEKLETLVTEGSEVQATGTVRQFIRAELERDYGITSWGYYGLDAADDDFFVEYDRRPVLIADTLHVQR